MVKLLKKILIVVGLLCLGGCSLLENKNTREYMEKHFSYLEKVYPTKNVEELFEKFPKGATINYYIAIDQEGESVDVSYFNFTVDSKQRRIYGTERKENISNSEEKEIYTENVEYKNGEITYPENPEKSSQKFTFLFEQIDYSELESFELRTVRYDYQQPLYAIGYWTPLNHYEFNGLMDQHVYLSIQDYGRKNPRIEIGRDDLNLYIVEEFVGGENE